MSSEAEIAWAAGLFEGEGTWGYWSGAGISVHAELSMTDFEIVRRFGDVVGVGRYYDKKSLVPHYKPQLCWRITSRREVQRVRGLLGPWLGERRLVQVDEALRIQAESIAANAARRDASCKNGHPRTPENTYHYWHKQHDKPARACAVCRAANARKQRVKLAAAALDGRDDG